MRNGTIVQMLSVLAFVLMFVTGCSDKDYEPYETDANMTTIQTYLEKEFKGPGSELIGAFEKEDPYPPELQAYVEKNYTPLVANTEQFLNKNHILLYLRFAHENGYKLNTKSIHIERIDDNQVNAFNYEAEVNYSKNGKTNTATVTGRMNINDNGKISIIRNIDDGGLLEKLNQK
ncbi:hypothetical protein IMZ08_13780 [Bacillus luteolus]|uniref:Lipoprotein n=1 Tax=Litchfieldia luteola TaxID=682179 RepID=A0ABR9QKW2_9BACI|nr:hypothetical protein [Cytobacillus luteolus]MBE4909133.1 hypothetical protein [Cytobacillus luteolus]MBP1940416.1 hypothetical protein [Cytobacillus luteolus]